ncbi:MAG: DUF3369 domain-containing protein [Clostridia bacterium]|nr:DUF3369 domain-containing protein [Clostridia bacterium]
MTNKINLDNVNFDFLSEPTDQAKHHEEKKQAQMGTYKILIADDDEEVHTITKMILNDFEFDGLGLSFIDTFSGDETKKVLRDHSDIAVAFLDVVMEEHHSGLEVVEYMRNTLKNHMTRIILRTGQPGEAPEEQVIRDFDINDYRLKTEMTVKRLYTTLYSALRNYRDLNKLDNHRRGLEKIIQTSANLFKHNSLTEFLTSILSQLSEFYKNTPELIYFRDDHFKSMGGFVTLDKRDIPTIVAATGKYEPYIGKSIQEVEELKNISVHMQNNYDNGTSITYVGNGFIIKTSSKNNLNNYIFIEGEQDVFDFDLINLFLTNYSVALDNYILTNMISTTQKEIIITLGEVVEKHFDETSGHVKRLSEMMYKLALHMHFSYSECEVLKVASTMHDVGKIAIPDNILKKPGRLTPDEFEVVKEHPVIGYKILSKSDLEILKVAAEIALNHHEKWDGTGYPSGLSGQGIPLYSRMLAIIDVFDAMTHERVYKEASSIESTLEYIKDEKGKHFDPKIVDIFISNIEDIIAAADD